MGPRPPIALVVLVLLGAWLSSSCASLEFKRDTPTSGTFESTAWAFTIISFDIPGPAELMAKRNISASGRPNLRIEEEVVTPYLGWFDWVLDILFVRHARVTGTWGHPPRSGSADGDG